MSIIGKIISFLINEVRSIFKSIHSSYKSSPPEIQKGARRLLVFIFIVVVIFIGYDYGHEMYERKEMEAELAKGPHVKTAKAILSASERKVQVLGEARPFAQITLYAKVSGYLKEIRVDKGDLVGKGQILAVIDSPETDKAYQAALSDAKNKKAISARIDKLLKRDLVSAQEAETAKSDAEVAAARLESAASQKSDEILRAPFAGTVTARYADVGALVQNAMNSQTSALPMLSISQVNQLRVYIYLDQRDAQAVSKGTPATITLTERPDLQLIGHVERVTAQLDEKTRMLLAEVDIDNANGEIVAGSLVQVSVDLKTVPGVMVPSESLVLRAGKTMVPVVDDKNEVVYTEVKVIDNDGKNIKIQSGLNPGQVVALNLGNTLTDHSKVRPEATPPAAPVAPAAPAAPAGEPKVAPATDPSKSAPSADAKATEPAHVEEVATPSASPASESAPKPVAQKKSAKQESKE